MVEMIRRTRDTHNFCRVCHTWDSPMDQFRLGGLIGRYTTEPPGTTRFHRTGGVNVKARHDCVLEVCVCGRWAYLSHQNLYDKVGYDRNTTSAEHIRAVSKKFFEMFPQPVAEFLRAELRRELYENIQNDKRFVWERDLPQDVVRWAYGRIGEEVDDSCKDNYRVADKNSRRQVRHYRKAQAHGCCGRCDFEDTYGGVTYLLGCNYGH